MKTGKAVSESAQRSGDQSSVRSGEPRNSRATGRYLPSLDGWRAVAISWVIISHHEIWQVGPINDYWVQHTGSRAVQLFFALSGYLICTRLLQEEKRGGFISLKSFYIRRLFRIQPAALTYLAVVALLGLVGIIPFYWQGIAGAALMVRNYWPEARVSSYWYTGHFWSLAVEEHFYLFLPGFLVLCRRDARLWVNFVLLVVAEAWRVIVFDHPHMLHFHGDQYQRTDTAIGAILLGSTVALALEDGHVLQLAKRYLRPGLALLYAAFVLWLLGWHHSRFYNIALITIYPAVIVSTVLHPTSWVTRFLELAPMRFVGRISYSLYLWQQIFALTPEGYSPFGLNRHPWLCWVLPFVCAVASYYLVERPFVQIGHRLTARKSKVAPAAAVA